MFLGCNVHGNAPHPDRISLPVKLDPAARRNPKGFTIRTNDPMFALINTVAFDRLRHRRRDNISIVRVQRVQETVKIQFLQAVHA